MQPPVEKTVDAKAIVPREPDKKEIDITKPPKKRALVVSEKSLLLPTTLPKAPVVQKRTVRTDIVFDAEKSLIAVVRKNKGTKLTKEARERKKKRARAKKKKKESVDEDEDEEDDDDEEENDEENTKVEESEKTATNVVVGGEARNDETVPQAMRPKIGLVDGKIQLKKSTVLVNTGDAANKSLQNSTSMEYPLKEGPGIYISSSMFKKKVPARRWTANETRTFYGGLQQCGLNFGMIARLFPDRSRKQIVLKFKREEKKHPNLVDKALTTRKPMNKEIFKHNVDLDPKPKEKEGGAVVADKSTKKKKKKKKKRKKSAIPRTKVPRVNGNSTTSAPLRRSKRIRSVSQSSQI